MDNLVVLFNPGMRYGEKIYGILHYVLWNVLLAFQTIDMICYNKISFHH